MQMLVSYACSYNLLLPASLSLPRPSSHTMLLHILCTLFASGLTLVQCTLHTYDTSDQRPSSHTMLLMLHICCAHFRLYALHNFILHTQLLFISCIACTCTCISHVVHSEHCNLHILDDIPFAGLFAKHILPYNAQEHLEDCTHSTKKHTLNKLLRKEG